MRGRNRSLCHPAREIWWFFTGTSSPAVEPGVCIQTMRGSWEYPGTEFDLKLHEYVKILARPCYMRAHESFNQTRDTWYWTARCRKTPAGWLVWCLIYLAPPTKRQRRATRPTLFCQSNKTGTVGPPISIASNLIIKRRQFSTKFVSGLDGSTVVLLRDCNFNVTSRCITCTYARTRCKARCFAVWKRKQQTIWLTRKHREASFTHLDGLWVWVTESDRRVFVSRVCAPSCTHQRLTQRRKWFLQVKLNYRRRIHK